MDKLMTMAAIDLPLAEVVAMVMATMVMMALVLLDLWGIWFIIL
jgi:hypothetical protein